MSSRWSRGTTASSRAGTEHARDRRRCGGAARAARRRRRARLGMGGRARTTPGGDYRRERGGLAGVRTPDCRRPRRPCPFDRGRGSPGARVRRAPPSLRAPRRARRRACRPHGRCSGVLDGHPHQRVRIDGRGDAAGADRPDERSHQHDRHLAARGIDVRRPHRSVLVPVAGVVPHDRSLTPGGRVRRLLGTEL